jgi:predicted ABC-type ATPase
LPKAPRHQQQLRLRIFAGPNGSGKSTVIKAIRKTETGGKPIDFGIYINADDIAVSLASGKFNFKRYKVTCDKEEIIQFAQSSGLISSVFSINDFRNCFILDGSSVRMKNKNVCDRLAQVIARFLREKLLEARKRFSFETVFSHRSNLDIMKRAGEAGYKIYLYFVSTEAAEINKYRVKFRLTQKGHYVPPDKIETRYYRSLELLYEAAELAYQAFFFDNSQNDEPFRLVGHFKLMGDKKKWDRIPRKKQASWFKKYYLDKRSQ